MRRSPLYSSASRKPEPEPVAAAPAGKDPASSWRDLYKRRRKPIAIAAAAGLFFLVVFSLGMRPAPPALTQADVDAAVVRVLKEKTLPSPAAKAYQAVRPAVVRVRAGADSLDHDEYSERAVGSGVVVVESGLILTNLHVVAGAGRITVVFADGQKSEAKLVSAQPENDLAVIQASVLPDDLKPATLGSAKDLAEGDDVIAVGFPFGIGPSVSSGVVSGLKREYRSPEGKRMLTDLIQFDAAANPGSSGGPLVNAAGEVVGIVTAILSPTDQGTFAGIGFAVPIQTAAAAAGLPPF
jgi:S1-C subfamily serine protease